MVQLCRLYKARYLQLHLTDDQGWTFPSTKYPQLGSKNYAAHGGIAPRVYKLEELKELVAYRRRPRRDARAGNGSARPFGARRSRSLPEIFDAINPESKQPVGMGCMNMSNEAIYPALDTIIGEMCDVFQVVAVLPHRQRRGDRPAALSLHPGYKAFMAEARPEGRPRTGRPLHRDGLRDGEEARQEGDQVGGAGEYGDQGRDHHGLGRQQHRAPRKCSPAATRRSPARGTWACRGKSGTCTCCNASRLKKGDSVLGATLVAWEQPPLTHITNLRKLARRQERTWGPDNGSRSQGSPRGSSRSMPWPAS